MEIKRLGNGLDFILILKGFSGVSLREEERATVVNVIVRGLALLFGMSLNGDDSVCDFFVELGDVLDSEMVIA